MNYFCDVHLQARQDEERRIFIALEGDEAPTPALTKEILADNNQYKEFLQKYKPKLVMADYSIYYSDTDINAATQDEIFEELINTASASLVGRSELRMDYANKSKSTLRKKKSFSGAAVIIAIGAIVVVGMGMFSLGKNIGKDSAETAEAEQIKHDTVSNGDGMIVPVQDEIEDGAEQITVSIDRSYSAIPMEDLQLKGAVVDGKAKITLPQFDKTDFFTHVVGHTWGFTSDPNGKKIEYYGGNTYTFTEDTKLYRVLVKYGGGSGTKDDPYLIDYFDQLNLMSEEKSRGYFKQVADISFPEWSAHTPINTVNELKSDPQSEWFEYNGGGYTISGLTAPLFGTVSGALIQNVNIKNSVIRSAEYKDYGFIACNAYNYRYTANGTSYETGETIIKHCSVSHSAIYSEYPEVEASESATEVVTTPEVVPPNLIEYDENGNPIETPIETEPTKSAEYSIGAITGNGGKIDGCYVTDFGIYAKIDDYYLYAGGISGKPAEVSNSAVYFFSAQGNIFNGGGIAGNGSGSRYYSPTGEQLPENYGGSIKGCTARNIILHTELAAGGIAGEGGSNATEAIISNCYANELSFSVGEFENAERTKVKKAGVSGGIIGCDGSYLNGHKIMNTVSSAEFSAIGKRSKSSFDDSIRLAPAYAFYQHNILTVLNKNTINPDNPKEIFTGSFKFGDSNTFGDSEGSLPYPTAIEDLFTITAIKEEQ